jgi:hypothetical protein
MFAALLVSEHRIFPSRVAVSSNNSITPEEWGDGVRREVLVNQ